MHENDTTWIKGSNRVFLTHGLPHECKVTLVKSRVTDDVESNDSANECDWDNVDGETSQCHALHRTKRLEAGRLACSYMVPFARPEDTVWILQYIQWIYAKSQNVIGQLSLPVKN
jgi:hypothetical protein